MLAANLARSARLRAGRGGRRGVSRRPRRGRGRGLGGGGPVRVPHLPGQRGAAPQHRVPRLHPACPRGADPVPAHGRPAPRWRDGRFMLLQGLARTTTCSTARLLLGLVLAALARPRPASRARLAVAARPARWAPRCSSRRWRCLTCAVARARDTRATCRRAIDLVHYVSTTPTNLVYGAIGTEVRLQQRGPHFVGFVSLALAGDRDRLWAAGRRRRRAPARAAGARLGPRRGAPGRCCSWRCPWDATSCVFGPLRSGRVPIACSIGSCPASSSCASPSGSWLLAMLFVALLVAARAERSSATRWPWLALLLAAAVPLEHLSTAARDRARARGRAACRRSTAGSRRTRAGAIAEVPVHGEGLVREETLEMYFSAYHWKPIIHGYTAYPPLLTRLLRRLAAEFPSDGGACGAARVGVDTVVVHHGRPLAPISRAACAIRRRPSASRSPAPRGPGSLRSLAAGRGRRGASAWRRGSRARRRGSSAARRTRCTASPPGRADRGRAVPLRPRRPRAGLGAPLQGRRPAAGLRRRLAHGLRRPPRAARATSSWRCASRARSAVPAS